MLLKLRERMASEKGFTLIELLVVMLIIGILAAIAIPTFFNQKQKANDSSAKAMAHTAQTAMETCGTDNNGSYAACDLARCRTSSSPSAPAATPSACRWLRPPPTIRCGRRTPPPAIGSRSTGPAARSRSPVTRVVRAAARPAETGADPS